MRRGLASAAVCAVLAAVAVLLAGTVFDRSAPAAPNGDQLGQEPGESFSAYRERAGESLAAAAEAAEAWALITFSSGLDPRSAALATEPVTRASALIAAPGIARVIPEPTGTDTRVEVFARELARVSGPGGGQITGVLAHAGGAQLRQVAGADGVAAVEVLPPDATWGRFGVRPVTPSD